ncbi:MAG TPA: hypothetical protein VFX58_06230 [Chitinophagaceae bacterium]|nr:hypothetical protein [Chitinophagaceae bacterium]
MKSSVSKLKILTPDPAKYKADAEIRSYLSFYPYYRHLQKRIQNPNEQFLGFYLYVKRKLEEHPELLQPLIDPETIEKHNYLFQLIAATIFPFSTDNDLEYFALGAPYKFEFFCYSDSFAEYFSPNDYGHITFPPERPFEQIQSEYILMAYRLIFRKFFGIEIKIPERRTNRWIDKATGLPRYSRIHIDESFIEVKLVGELPSFPQGLIDQSGGFIIDPIRLQQELPLSLFSFEGFIIRRSIVDVTVEECVTEVKNALIEMQSANPQPGYKKLKSAVETIIGIKNVEVSLTPFLKLNQQFIFYNKYSGRSIMLKGLRSQKEKEAAYIQLALLLEREKKTVFINNCPGPGTELRNSHLASFLKNEQDYCYIVAPLFDNNELIGMLEAASPNAEVLNNHTLKKFEPVYSFFEIACRNYISQFKNEVGSLILEKFTALQPVVEWKFLEEAWDYLKEKETDPSREIGAVSFDQIYPVYGIVDVKNSSAERSRCYQKDLLDELNLIASTLHQLEDNPHKLIREFAHTLLEKNNDLRRKIEHNLLAEDEEKVNEFLELEVKPFFKDLSLHHDAAFAPVIHYFESVDPVSGHLNKNKRDFEESIGKINTTISRYLETEQAKIQQLYPHYFEKYRTDGVEYNIYLGQSFTPHTRFDFHNIKKIRLWQLFVMAEIARLTHQLVLNIPIPLQTTQLVLVYNKPICISFRNDERRFDVKGSESVGFEILKKRIDKVTIKKTGERLTKPGTIAIVYSHAHDIDEYHEYFEALQKNHIVTNDIEMLELEDVQSISGLKAIRIRVNVDG